MASLLSLPEIATELDTDLLSVHRLVAVGAIPVTAIGERLVIIPDIFVNWVKTGADGFRDLRDVVDPVKDTKGAYRAQEAARAIRNAAYESQRVPNETLEVRGRRQAGAGSPGGMLTASLAIPIVPTQEIRSVVSEPLKTSMKIRGTKTQPAGDYHLSEAIRVGVQQQWENRRRQPGSGKPIDPDRAAASWLYSLAPAEYRQVIDEAIKQAMATVVSFDEVLSFPDRGEGSLRLSVVYSLATSAWAAPSRARSLADEMF